MSPVLEVIAVVAIVAYVIVRQLQGEPLRGRRLLVLPVVLTVIGAVDLGGHGSHPGATDVALIALSALAAVAIGLRQGTVMRLERRDGYLWGQMPAHGLWLWCALLVTRGGTLVAAHAAGATVAAGTASILLVLGLNRLAQALVVGARAVAGGVPFAPERDGDSFAAGLFTPARPATDGPATAPPTLRAAVEQLLERARGHRP